MLRSVLVRLLLSHVICLARQLWNACQVRPQPSAEGEHMILFPSAKVPDPFFSVWLWLLYLLLPANYFNSRLHFKLVTSAVSNGLARQTSWKRNVWTRAWKTEGIRPTVSSPAEPRLSMESEPVTHILLKNDMTEVHSPQDVNEICFCLTFYARRFDFVLRIGREGSSFACSCDSFKHEP